MTDHIQRRAVLYRAAWVEELGLGQDSYVTSCCKSYFKQGSIADPTQQIGPFQSGSSGGHLFLVYVHHHDRQLLVPKLDHVNPLEHAD